MRIFGTKPCFLSSLRISRSADRVSRRRAGKRMYLWRAVDHAGDFRRCGFRPPLAVLEQGIGPAACSTVAERGHADILADQPLAPDPASVTMPNACIYFR